jgi:hypothetical protein
MWQRPEIENYLCQRETLLRFVAAQGLAREQGELLASPWKQLMAEAIDEMSAALQTLGKPDPWSPDLKVSEEFLDPLFKRFYEKLKLPNLMRKTDYHTLAPFVAAEQIDPQVIRELDLIAATAKRAQPRPSTGGG